MVVAFLAVAAAMTCMPIFAVVLVSMASRLEDRAWTLAGPPSGLTRAAARHIVGFRSAGIDWLLHAGSGRSGQLWDVTPRRPG